MARSVFVFAGLLALAAHASGQGFSPEEAVKRMKMPDGFSARCVASEPMIRQPVSMSFDNRGRLWVLQYLQYPNYEGLKPVKQDQYLRTIWDKIPEPPPKGPKGADKLTILYEPDAHGVFSKSKDFVTGLNIASGFCLAPGGVYVVQPPYLLFYPDKNEDDVPDGDPEVLLTGFGMDDTHSLANSLQFGPDGWLYGATGSTSTCKIKNPAHAKDAVVEFQQGIWRYHPATKKFELFSEGGGNTYGLDFDKNGQAIAGTNYGGVACLHQMQGAYYVKGFSKHGPLHNPHTYGYFEHVPYTGFKGGHVTCGGIVYQADTYPAEFRDQYIAANLLSNAVNWHKLEAVKSSFKASHGGELLEANDNWFRPVDLIQGPDGCVYVADFYDKRAAHLDPVDNWDKTNGRIYRIEYKGGPKFPTFDLRKLASKDLLEFLSEPNVWWRREARQILAERKDATVYPALRKTATEGKGQVSLEALWALFASGGTDLAFLKSLYKHKDEYVRAWAVRLTADVAYPHSFRPHMEGGDPAGEKLMDLAHAESSLIVRCQLACTARRLEVSTTLTIVRALMARDDNIYHHRQGATGDVDPGSHLALLCWWAIEERCSLAPRQQDYLLGYVGTATSPLSDPIIERVARRLLAPDIDGGQKRLAAMLNGFGHHASAPMLRGIATASEAGWLAKLHPDLLVQLRKLLEAKPEDATLLAVFARAGDAAVIETFLKRVADTKLPDATRLAAIEILKQVRPPEARELFLSQFVGEKADGLRVALLAGLEAFDDAKIGATVLAAYPSYPPVVKKRAVQLLLARPTWALPVLKQLDAGKFPKADISVEQARAAIALGDKELTPLVEKHFGKLAVATAGEKQARIDWLNVAIGRESGDAMRGKVLFTKHCAACHQLHGEGGKVGPDITTADRKNRRYMLTQIVDPSGYIRPEFVVQTVLTTDERKLSGIAKEVGETIELSNWVENKVVVTVIPKKDIADIRPSAVSLMPDKLLDSLTYGEIADLFVYIVSDNKAPDKPAKLKVSLVSGSFEYKSDASLVEFQKYLEANFDVECTRIFATSDKDKTLAGIENLAKCDVALFFTRRLQIEGESLDAVKAFIKSGKPIIGLRTASHGFQNWLALDKDILGGDYQGHYGEKQACEVKVAEKQKDQPILKGVSPFKSNGSLYKNPNVAADVTVLLTGSIPDHAEPVAWTREKDGRRVFYTSLGHPDDFKDANFTRLLVNGLAWATKTELKAKK